MLYEDTFLGKKVSKMRIEKFKVLKICLSVLVTQGITFILFMGGYYYAKFDSKGNRLHSLSALHDNGQDVREVTTEVSTIKSTTTNRLESITHGIHSSMSDFQSVHADGNIFVYSAHLNDVIDPPVVTVIGLGVLKTLPQNVTCRFSGSILPQELENSLHNNSTLETTGKVITHPDHHNARHGAVLIHCDLPANLTQPRYVTLLENISMQALSNLTIHLPKKQNGTSAWKMTMCFPPLHGNYNNWKQIFETFEIVRMLGADHAVIYVMNVGVNASRILEHYRNIGFLELYSWIKPPQNVHYNGQIAAINDCLLRMRYVSELVVIKDLDEMMIPRLHNTWFELLDHIRHQAGNDSKNIGAFMFQNAFFYTEPYNTSKNPVAQTPSDQKPDIKSQTNLTDEQIKLACELGMETVLRQYRAVNIWKAPSRSKNIVDPLKVLMMGIHFADIFVPGYKSVVVDTNVAILHHYRLWSVDTTVRDTAAIRFVPELIVRIQKKFKDILL